jgi:cytochrome c-type biogenesis protein CcmF
MDYIGEHLLPGKLGHFFIILSLVTSLLATFAYFKMTTSKNELEKDHWKKLARISFGIECISVFAIFGFLFYIIQHHLFEYKYAWQHSSLSLEFKYLLACFWEGQEGSFMLWTFWHCVLGLILIRKAKDWEGPVMTVVSFAQFSLATMIVGLYFFGHKVGSNPFVLLRNEMAAPIFSQPNYLSLIKDGNDLNPLLQNYWMVIHPPVLFMGFASTLIPFAYVIAALWTKRYTEWTKPVLSWSLFSAGVLGLGIMMGGAWAYESLNFGGYWAWDPVENASLVPWLVMVAGIHTVLIFRHTGQALKASFFFLVVSFLLVLYSTFLTRSGILGDTSVHAFTDLGMNVQLLLFLYIFVWIPPVISASKTNTRFLYIGIAVLLLFLSQYFEVLSLISMLAALVIYQLNLKQVDTTAAKEENASSREFWMFIGSLMLFLSSGFIIIATSLPVINKLFDTKVTMGEDVVFSYNRVIIFVVIVIVFLTAITQYLRYKETPFKVVFKKIALPTVVALVISTLVLAFGKIDYMEHGAGFLGAVWLALVCSIYSAVANAAYIWIGMNGKFKSAGGSIAHFGFGVLLVGILISSSKKQVLSYNTSGIFVPMGEENKITGKTGENLTLVKGVPASMGKYAVTYESDSMNPKKPLWYYRLHFRSKEDMDEFTLTPNAFVNYKGNMGLMANPDAKHYWDHDIFTYITSLPDPQKNNDTTTFKNQWMKAGDTCFYSHGFFILEDFSSRDNLPADIFKPGDSLFLAKIKVFSKEGTSYTAIPKLAILKNQFLSVPDTVVSQSLILNINKKEGAKVELGFREPNTIMQYLTLKAYDFPYINLVWLGTLIMVFGFLWSMIYRISLNKNKLRKI